MNCASTNCASTKYEGRRRPRDGFPRLRTFFFVLALFSALAPPAFAAERYAVIVPGASGGDTYEQKYATWRASFAATLRDAFQYPQDRLFILGESEGSGVDKATKENVQRVLGALRKRLTRDDQLLVLLIGHGTTLDGEEAKFNLVGPDLSATEWSDLLKPIPGRLVFVNTSSASFPFLRKLAGRNRIVLTSTDSSAQQFETVFPEFFVEAFAESAADVDKNGRVSIWEAFNYASAGVKQYFDQKGQLPTERPVVYVTLGTEVNNEPGVYPVVLQTMVGSLRSSTARPTRISSSRHRCRSFAGTPTSVRRCRGSLDRSAWVGQGSSRPRSPRQAFATSRPRQFRRRSRCHHRRSACASSRSRSVRCTRC